MRLSKQKNTIIHRFACARRSKPVVLVVLSTVLVAASLTQGFGVLAASCGSSTDCAQQINGLTAANNNAQSSIDALAAQAGSYQAAIAQLQSQISALQAQIAANQAEQADIQAQITQQQQELDAQKAILGNDIKTSYVSGQLTPVEALATSNNLSDYIDKQEAYARVQDTIQKTMAQIQVLQHSLQAKKAQIDLLLNAQEAQNQQLTDASNQQTELLNYNQSQQDQLNSQISANKSQIDDLRRQQFLYNVRTYGQASYGGTGSYPYADAHTLPGDTYCWGYNNDGSDSCTWSNEYDPKGWSYRNCTSYAFWRLAQAQGVVLPAGYFPNVRNSGGKIGYSIPDFRNLGYTVDHNPDGASLAVSGAGPYGSGYYGHIMYVESSNPSGAYVSQYNYAGDGRYSTMSISADGSTWFVHL